MIFILLGKGLEFNKGLVKTDSSSIDWTVVLHGTGKDIMSRFSWSCCSAKIHG